MQQSELDEYPIEVVKQALDIKKQEIKENAE